MAARRHTVRKLRLARTRSLDDRLGPVLLGIWGLALYAIAIYRWSTHDGTPESQQRWIMATGLVVAIGAVVSAAVVWIPPRRLRRALVLALCLSLALNLSLMVGLSYIRLEPHRPVSQATPPPDPREEHQRTYAEYYPLAMEGDDRPEQEEQQPVSTGEPELASRDLIKRTSVIAADRLPLRSDAVPETAHRPMTAAILREKFVESAPRRHEWQGTLSRQTIVAQPELGSAGHERVMPPRPTPEETPRAVPLESEQRVTPSRIANTPMPDPLATATVPDRMIPDRTVGQKRRRLEPRGPGAAPSVEQIVRETSPSITRPLQRPPTSVELGESPDRRLPLGDDRRFHGPAITETGSRIVPQVRPVRRRPPRVAREKGDTSPERRWQSVEADEASPLPGELRRTEAAGLARSASEPEFRPSVTPVGPAADRVASPNNRSVATLPSQRRRLTGPLRATETRVDLSKSAAINVAESPEVAAAQAAPTDVKLGRTYLPEVASLPGGAPIDIGARPPVARATARRNLEGGLPDVARPAAQRLTTGRLSGEGHRPALPTDVQRPEVMVRPTRVAAPSAATIAGVRGRDQQLSMPSALDIDARRIASSTPHTAPAAATQPDRVDAVDDLPEPVSSSIGATERTEESHAAPPLRTPVPLPHRPREIVEDPRRLPQGAPTLDDPVRDVAAAPETDSVGRRSATSLDASPSLTAVPRIARRSIGALPVDVQARQGLGGLSSDISTDIGLLQRQSQRDSDQIVDSVGRFIRRPVGGPLSINREVAIPARAYQTRMNRRGELPAGGNGRPSPRTEEAIELGLLYLAEQQRADGSWTLAVTTEVKGRSPRTPPTIRSDTAATGLSLLSFLGAGYHHRTDKYGNVVREGLEYLVLHQQTDGSLYVTADKNSNRSAWLYSHAIASIALCEAFGMTQDPHLRDPAQKAIDFIVHAQHSERGGWRYTPRVGSDTSVSGWMVMALRSAELANLAVPVEAWQRVDIWLDMAKESAQHPERYRYNPLAPNTVTQGHGRRPTKTMTAVGLLMRLYTGWRRDDQQMTAGADYLMNHLPEIGSLRDPQRDTYYWYYATQVMFHMRGDYWRQWNEQLHELLTTTQQQIGPMTGSWDPWSPIPDRWAPHAGRLYVTTMNLLSLEVYYRHLPIYEDTGR